MLRVALGESSLPAPPAQNVAFFELMIRSNNVLLIEAFQKKIIANGLGSR